MRNKGPIWKEYKDEDVTKDSFKNKFRECKHCGALVCAVSTRLNFHFKNVCPKRPRPVGQLAAGDTVSTGEVSSMHAEAADVIDRCLPLHSPQQDVVNATANPKPNKRLKRATQKNLECDGSEPSPVSPSSHEDKTKGTKSFKCGAEANAFRDAKLRAATELAAATNKKANAMMERIDIDIFQVNTNSSELSEAQKRFFLLKQNAILARLEKTAVDTDN